jgi:hypothetical protein
MARAALLPSPRSVRKSEEVEAEEPPEVRAMSRRAASSSVFVGASRSSRAPTTMAAGGEP